MLILRLAVLVCRAACSSYETRVATGHADGSVRNWDPSAGKVVVTIPPSATASVSGVAWHPAGRWVATGQLGINRILVWDTATGRVVTDVGTGMKIVAIATGSNPIFKTNERVPTWPTGLWPDGTAIHLEPTVPTEAREGTVASSIDGKWELFVRRDWNAVDRNKWVVEVREASTRKVVTVLKGHSGNVTVASFSPDGSRVVTDGVQVWDARTGAELFALRGHTGGVAAASYSPDRSRVATWGRAGTVRVWDATTGAELLVLKGPPVRPTESDIRLVSWSPDGYRLLTTAMGRDVTILDATPLGR